MNKNYYSKRSKKIKYFLTLFCLFLLATVIPPVMAEVSSPTPTVRVPANPANLVKQAGALYQEQKYQAAIPLWQRAVDDFAQAGDRQNQAMALSNLSLTYQQLGQWADARGAIATSLKLLETEPDNSLILAQTLDIKGKLERETGKPAAAVDSWQQAATIYHKLDNHAALTQNNLHQARALQDLGLYPRACKRILSTLSWDNLATCPQISLLTTAELTTKLEPLTAKPDLTKISALRNLGNLLLIIGQPQRSETVLNASLKAAEKFDSPQELSLTYLKLANTYQALARTENNGKSSQYRQQTLSAYERAIALSTSDITKLKAQLNQLGFLIQQEQWTQAESLWNSLNSELVANQGLGREQIYASINYVQNIVKVLTGDNKDLPTPNIADLKQILDNAIQQARALGDNRAEAHAWGTLGRLEEITGEYTVAETNTQKALNLVSNYDAADITYQYFWQLGRIQKQKGNISEAIAFYTKAYSALQSLRSDIATINPEVQFDFRDEVEPVYRELVELDLTDAASLETNNDTQTSQARLVQAREVIESLQLAQLNNFFQEACIEAQPQLLDQITDKNESDLAIIYPILLEDRFEIILKLPRQPLRRYSKSFEDSKRVQRILSRLNLTLTQSNSLETLPLAQQVYDWIIQPLASDLAERKIKTLIFVLDNPLQNIPMAVLHDGKQYLVEKYALALTPGLQLLDPKPLTTVRLNAITGGLSEVRNDFAPHRNFGNLPKVTEELQTIKNVGIAKSSLLNSQFTKDALKQKIIASGSPIVHLATHAKFSSKAEDTFILSWDGQINIKDLDDLLRDDTFNRKNDIELLVLSACETASGDPRATLGLAGVAVQAGARSTLATLWSVVDESTAQLMGEFYNQLQKSLTTKANKAEVLRQAQLALIKDEKFNHPHFWSPFILVGNWQ